MAIRRVDITGRVFDVQRFSIHDGPGIRTTVFLKGCPLRCAWCHNPEGVRREVELSFDPARCIGCGYCFRVCPRGAHRMLDGRHVLDRELCQACGACASECYAKALEQVGRDVSVADVMADVLADRAFYETSGGGITLSGGEPMMQLDFAAGLLAAAKDHDIPCCVETCGHAAWEAFERIGPMVDLFLYDWKETDPARHRRYTGVSNDLIRRNLLALHEAGAKVLLRCPIIPGLNDRPDHFEGIAALCRELPRLAGVEVLAYHRLGVGKTHRLAPRDEEPPAWEMPPREALDRWADALREMGAPVVNSL